MKINKYGSRGSLTFSQQYFVIQSSSCFTPTSAFLRYPIWWNFPLIGINSCFGDFYSEIALSAVHQKWRFDKMHSSDWMAIITLRCEYISFLISTALITMWIISNGQTTQRILPSEVFSEATEEENHHQFPENVHFPYSLRRAIHLWRLFLPL